MSNYGSRQYTEKLKFGEIREQIIEDFLRKRKDKIVEKYISYDDNGNVTWQSIHTKYGKLRHPDFKVYDALGELFVLIEVKSLEYEYSNKRGLVKNIPKNSDEVYLTIEKSKFDDYVLVQSYYECECRIIFVVGTDSQDKKFYWETLDNMKNCIISECRPYGEQDSLCYLWSIFDLNWGLKDII